MGKKELSPAPSMSLLFFTIVDHDIGFGKGTWAGQGMGSVENMEKKRMI